MDQLEKTLRQMPQEFSSNHFMRTAIKNGVDPYSLSNGKLAQFLKDHAVNNGSKRSWRKKNELESQLPFEEDKIIDAIKLLKSRGYKIMRPISEFVEI